MRRFIFLFVFLCGFSLIYSSSLEAFQGSSKQHSKYKQLERKSLPDNIGRRQAHLKHDVLVGNPKEKDPVIKAVEEYVKKNPALLEGLSFGDLKLHYSAQIPATAHKPGMVFVQYIQVNNGLKVDGSSIDFAVKILKDRSVVMSVKVRVFPDLALPRTQAKDDQYLKNLAKEKRDDSSDEMTGENKIIRYLEGKWRKVYQAKFQKDPSNQYVIDATTGEFLGIEDIARDASPGLRGNVSGRGVLSNPAVTGNNLNVLPLKNLKITAGNGSFTFTDELGNFNFNSITFATTLSAELKGPWADVYNCANFSPTNDCFAGQNRLNQTVMANPQEVASINFNPNGNPEFDTAQVNAYYHVNSIHNWLKARLPVDFTGIDIPIVVAVNFPNYCGAFYNDIIAIASTQTNYLYTHQPSGTSVVYDLCRNAAFDTVVYHEYGHFVDDMMGGFGSSPDMAEGYADLISIYATGNPVVGEGWTEPPLVSPVAPLGLTRTAENNCQYSPDSTWVNLHLHHGCYNTLVVSGFGWHLRQNLIARLGETEGKRVAETLFLSFMLSNSAANIPDMVTDIVIIDDDDDDLTNGTPHIQDILDAARRHGIPVVNQSPVFQSLNPTYEVNEGQDLTIDAMVCDLDNDKMTALVSSDPAYISAAPFQSCVFVWENGGFVERCESCAHWNQSIFRIDYDDAGIYQLNFSADDGHNHMVTAQSQLIVHNTNRFLIPTIPRIPSVVSERQLVNFDVSAQDIDLDDTLTISCANLPAGATFALISASPGTVTYRFTWTPNSNQAGTYDLTFIFDDGHGAPLSAGGSMRVVKDIIKPTVTSSLGAVTATTVTLNAQAADPAPSSGVDKIVYLIRQASINTTSNTIVFYNALPSVTRTASGGPMTFNTSTDVAKSWYNGYLGFVYTVTGFDRAGNLIVSGKYFYNGTTLIAPDTTAPAVPAGLTAVSTAAPASVNLAWDPVSDASGYVNYEVYRNGTLIFSTPRIVPVAGQKITYTNTNLESGTQYSYQVLARDMWSNKSAKSTVVTFSTVDPLAPTVPANLQGSQANYYGSDGFRASLSWNASTVNSGPISYEVYRNGVKVATTAARSYIDQGLPETTYQYKVRALGNVNHYSGFSNTVSVTIEN